MSSVETARDKDPVKPGDVLDGKFIVERVLGVGGMGVVVAARHIHLDEHVAIKFMLPEVAAKGGELVARFMREGRAAVKIRSEHVARVTDVGMMENGSPYLVMEYLEGRDLQQVLDTSGRLSVDDALDFVLQASEAIAEAHSLGIVHRDLKPANLFLAHRADGSSCVKVLDFGISKMSTQKDSGVTRTQTSMGSPVYMSPEQTMSAAAVDARADIWSLGVIVYQLVSGRVPFDADTIPQLVYKVIQEPAPPLRDVLGGAHPALDAAVMRCLEKDRAARFQTVGELALALAPAAPARAQLSVQRIMRLAGTRATQGTTGSGGSNERLAMPAVTPIPASPGKGRVYAVVALLVLGIAAGGGLLWMKHTRARDVAALPETTPASVPATAAVAPSSVAVAPSSASLAPESLEIPSSEPMPPPSAMPSATPSDTPASAWKPRAAWPLPAHPRPPAGAPSARSRPGVVPDDRQ